jgi:hypothetical protein
MAFHRSNAPRLRQVFSIFFPLFFLFTGGEAVSALHSGLSKVTWQGEKKHDFGDIQRERPVRHRFVFQNNFTDTLRLETVRTTCGCTAAQWTETPIAPGQQGEVMIEYDAYQRGTFKKKIRVFFDKQRKPELLYIMGKVE